jgi:DNA-binding HxlR family transcriptional regulator
MTKTPRATPLDRPKTKTSGKGVKGITANPWSSACPSRGVIDLLASRWVLLLVPLLRGGPRRNAELLRGAEGVSQKMLTQTLRTLERHGLVNRYDYHQVPPRVEYALTPLGHSLADTIMVLDDWVIRHYHEIPEQRKSKRR